MPPKVSLCKYFWYGRAYVKELRKELGLNSPKTITAGANNKPSAKSPDNKEGKKKSSTPTAAASLPTSTRAFTAAQDAAILAGRENKLTNAAIAAELGDGVTKEEVSIRYGELLYLATAVSEGADEGVEQQAQVVKKGEGVWGGGMKNNGGAGAAKKNKGDGGGGGNTIPIIKPSQQQQPQQGQQGYVTLEPDANFTAEEIMCNYVKFDHQDLPLRMRSVLRDATGRLVAEEVIREKFFEKT